MENLRKLIVEMLQEELLIKEAAFTPESLPPDLMIKVTKDPADPLVPFISDGFQVELLLKRSDESYQHAGLVAAVKDTDYGECHNAYLVMAALSKAKGAGPLLYDVAIDISSHLGGGLMSDRGSVSSDARRVWTFIEKNRPDIIKKQLDNLENELTPELGDNCDVEVAGKYESDWTQSPLSKVAYRPGLPVVKKLLKLRKIEIEDSLKKSLGL